MNKNERAQHRNLKEKHPDSKWKSGGGSPGNFLKKKQSEANVRRLKTISTGDLTYINIEINDVSINLR